ncbi:histone deacetylase complex subunit SAP130 isoform X1 [Cimex lectularius]|uniref:Histone deacetylase complex subunit SAP130 C-terminal domain-containing protein n=2 Tax=Cimex lectularius TaxID=79782 RepID=A0A8I6RU21_CIMLE|nr:histone deacetylase complex subunit SAP130 isoform X1 [Cimex lectularius]XP_014249715.1 histone deacetylase complex subunit SAP130 isoform X1 [Cimex lectularius]XP_014249716.1 histone deacetylase complex subunit SAP130 isoform X1 [Cimex lectularius]
MSETRDTAERPSQQQDGPPVKMDQFRNMSAGTLVRAIPTGQSSRFMMTPVQSSTALISTTTTIQAQVLSKVPAGATSVNRLNTLPIQSSATATTTGYHVPRGAAAVANISVPRASVATPIVRAPPQLQAIGVAPAHTGASAGPIVGRSVVGVTPWVTACLPPNPQSNPRQQSSQLRPPPVTTTKLMSNQIRPIPENQARPVLLHSTTKQVTLTQQAQVQVSGEKAVIKSYSGANQGTRMVTPVSAPPLSRITTSLPPMVSLHPAVLVPNNSSLPIKSATSQAKVISQPGATMQFTSVPVSSVQPAIAINSVVTRPGLVTVMLTSGGAQGAVSTSNITTMSTTPTTNTVARIPHNPKTYQEITSQPSSFVHTSMPSGGKSNPATQLSREQRLPTKDDTEVTSGSNAMVNLSNSVYTMPGCTYYDNYQISSRSSTTTSTSCPQNQPMSSSSQSVMSPNQNVRSVTVVDSSRSYLSASEAGNSSTDSSSSFSIITLSSGIPHNLTTKTNTSPRPSILRKRDPEGSPLKAQKNLMPVLSSLPISTGSPPGPGSPKRPESGHSGQSSAGSTTISANSSPGESPTIIKQEPSEDDHQSTRSTPVAPPIMEMSPRKKPRKQQLTGNQITEPTFSEDEMEFISEDKIKKEIKEELIFEEEKCLPKRTMSLLNSYKQHWKVRNNHFLRYTDVKTKEDRKPTLSELANQKHVLQKLDGWKIYHLGTQIEDMSNSEAEFFNLYSSLLSVLEIKQKKIKNKDLDKDIHRINERIRANFQRSKVVKDQMNEARTQVLKLFEHKGYVADIINRNATKRPLKKRERQ